MIFSICKFSHHFVSAKEKVEILSGLASFSKIPFCNIIYIMLNRVFWYLLHLENIHSNNGAGLRIGQSVVMVRLDVVAEMKCNGLQFVILQIWH